MDSAVNVSNTTQYSDLVAMPQYEFVVSIYSVLLIVGALGNVGMFTSLMKSRRRKSRVDLLMTHLVIADMMVTFIVIPLEIGWRTTNAWIAGHLACKIFLVLRAFGLYLSSNILVCISIDRYFAIIYPLRVTRARARSKMMLSFAWLIALLCSLPQSLVFRVLRHPIVPDFEQCVSFEAFENQQQELAYNVFCLCAMYFLPLMIITVCYVCIFCEISRNSRQNPETHRQGNSSRIMLRRSDPRPLVRARRRTLRMTITIVTVFACCWLPYAVMTLWYMIDRESARKVSAKIQDFFFIMAVSNSCMDPLVYGSFTADPKTITRTLRKLFCIHIKTSDTAANGPIILDHKPKIDNAVQDTTQLKVNCVLHCQLHFEDKISTRRRSDNYSDPIPCRTERSTDDRTMKSAHSCEVFTLYPINKEYCSQTLE